MDRRRFNTLLAMAGAGFGTQAFAAGAAPEVLQLSPNGWMPNNETLPVLLYRSAFASNSDMAAAMEAAFERNQWPPQWRNGVYDFHHFHSTAHEVLGFARGWGRLVLGGEGGHELVVKTGDVAVLPAGTGHCRLDASSDFLVIGAYPMGEPGISAAPPPMRQPWNEMRKVAFPPSDPVSGAGGPLVQHWRRA